MFTRSIAAVMLMVMGVTSLSTAQAAYRGNYSRYIKQAQQMQQAQQQQAAARQKILQEQAAAAAAAEKAKFEAHRQAHEATKAKAAESHDKAIERMKREAAAREEAKRRGPVAPEAAPPASTRSSTPVSIRPVAVSSRSARPLASLSSAAKPATRAAHTASLP